MSRIPLAGLTEETEKEMHRAKSKNRHRSGRRSRMTMVEEEESHLPNLHNNDASDDLINYSPTKRRIQNAKSADMSDTLQSIRNLKQTIGSSASGKQKSSVGPKSATGQYIRKLMKETDDDIEELTCKIEEDIELEKRLARELEEDRKQFSKSKNQKLPYMKPHTSLPSLSAVSNKENNPMNDSRARSSKSDEDFPLKTWAMQNSYVKGCEQLPRKDSVTSASSKEDKLVTKDERKYQSDRIENDPLGFESSQSLRIKSAKSARKLVGHTPAKISLMISHDGECEHNYMGGYLPNKRALSAKYQYYKKYTHK